LLFCQTPPPLRHAHVVCRSPRCSYLSFPNGSTLSVTKTHQFVDHYFVPREVTCIVSTYGHHIHQLCREICCL
jgi:hypothetical protein